jgi:hypothetical protein
MTETIEELIRARFHAAAPSDAGDWADVLARAYGGGRRLPVRMGAAAVAAVLAAAVTAVAFGWPQTVIDFISSPAAPANVVNWFAAQNVGAPKGMGFEAIPGKARKIATATFDDEHANPTRPTVHTLYVAPRKGGGFCYLWTNAGAGCLPQRNEPKALGPLGLDWLDSDYAVLVSGWVRTGATRTVEARFADGTTATIPVTWVSAPVDAGFLVYPVPSAHRRRRDALRSIVALDATGKVIGTQTFPVTKPLDEDVTQTLPDGTRVGILPRRADAAHARKIFDYRAPNGSPAYLWVMPRRGGGLCYFWNRGSGCLSRHWLSRVPTLNGGLFGPFYFAQAKPAVAAVELRYQDGARERLRPVDGFVLEPIALAHYKLGARLVTAVALGRTGKALSTEHFDPRSRGIYPCTKPLDLGHGVHECP